MLVHALDDGELDGTTIDRSKEVQKTLSLDPYRLLTLGG